MHPAALCKEHAGVKQGLDDATSIPTAEAQAELAAMQHQLASANHTPQVAAGEAAAALGTAAYAQMEPGSMGNGSQMASEQGITAVSRLEVVQQELADVRARADKAAEQARMELQKLSGQLQAANSRASAAEAATAEAAPAATKASTRGSQYPGHGAARSWSSSLLLQELTPSLHHRLCMRPSTGSSSCSSCLQQQSSAWLRWTAGTAPSS
jgi:hypothetical protein